MDPASPVDVACTPGTTKTRALFCVRQIGRTLPGEQLAADCDELREERVQRGRLGQENRAGGLEPDGRHREEVGQGRRHRSGAVERQRRSTFRTMVRRQFSGLGRRLEAGEKGLSKTRPGSAKPGDVSHINLAELTAMVQGVNLAAMWNAKRVTIKTDSATVYGWLRSALRGDKRIKASGLSRMLVINWVNLVKHNAGSLRGAMERRAGPD